MGRVLMCYGFEEDLFTEFEALATGYLGFVKQAAETIGRVARQAPPIVTEIPIPQAQLISDAVDERLTLVSARGANAYPLIDYEYAIVSVKQPSPEIAAALRRFLLWGDRARRG